MKLSLLPRRPRAEAQVCRAGPSCGWPPARRRVCSPRPRAAGSVRRGLVSSPHKDTSRFRELITPRKALSPHAVPPRARAVTCAGGHSSAHTVGTDGRRGTSPPSQAELRRSRRARGGGGLRGDRAVAHSLFSGTRSTRACRNKAQGREFLGQGQSGGAAQPLSARRALRTKTK